LKLNVRQRSLAIQSSVDRNIYIKEIENIYEIYLSNKQFILYYIMSHYFNCWNEYHEYIQDEACTHVLTIGKIF